MDDGWHPDPTGRAERRWRAGGRWTDTVWRDGAPAHDTFDGDPIAVPAAAMEPPATSTAARPLPVADAAHLDYAPPQVPAPGLRVRQGVAAVHPVGAGHRLRTGVPGPVAGAAAILCIIGFLLALGGLVTLLTADTVGDFGDAFDSDDFGSDFDDAESDLNGVGAVVLSIGVFSLWVGGAVMMAQRWARVAGVVIGALLGLLSLIGLGQGGSFASLITLTIAVLLVGFLLSPSASRTFRTRPISVGELDAPFRP